MPTLELLLALAGDQLPDALDGPLADEAARSASALGAGAAWRVAHDLRHHRGAALADGADLAPFDRYTGTGLVPSATRIAITGYDVVVELDAPEGTDPAALVAAAARLGQVGAGPVDPARSAAVLGTGHVIKPGWGPVQMFVCLRRPADQDHDAFCHWWLHELVEHTTKTPGKAAYRQLHADLALSARAAEAAGVAIDDVDGMALEHYPDLDTFYRAVTWVDRPGEVLAEHPGAEGLQAETRRLDFGRGALLAYGADGDHPVAEAATG